MSDYPLKAKLILRWFEAVPGTQGEARIRPFKGF